MAEPKFIPQPFQVPINAIASYDYTDLAEGTGIEQFYVMQARTTSAAALLQIAGSAQYSEETEYVTASVAADTTATVNIDLSEFNTPREVKGTANVVFSWQIIKPSAGGDTQGTGLIELTLQHWDGTTATDMATSETALLTTALTGAEATIARTSNQKFTVSKTHFKKGDVLRLKLLFKNPGDGTGAPNITFYVAINPLNQDTTNFTIAAPIQTTTFKLYSPFEINQ